MENKTKMKIDNSIRGASGVHYIASELSLRGNIALLTIKNTIGFDILVSTSDGSKHANLQVKTSLNKVTFWPVGEKYGTLVGENNYYVFLRYIEKEKRFETFLERSELVAKSMDERLLREQNQIKNPFTPCWYLPKNKQELEKLKLQWENFFK